jgi:hypothetical protein
MIKVVFHVIEGLNIFYFIFCPSKIFNQILVHIYILGLNMILVALNMCDFIFSLCKNFLQILVC